jgi:Tol biopolymer transport system component
MRTSAFLTAIVAASLAACDSRDEPAANGILEPGVAFSVVGGWGSAAPVAGSNLNTSALEGCPSESADGRSLFFASNRSGKLDIYVSHRQSNGEWGAPEPLDGVNSSANDFCPSALPGGVLLFVSERADQNCGAQGTADIYETRLHPAEGWLPPRNLGCTINSGSNEFSPSYVPAGGGMLFFSSDRSGPHGIYVGMRGPRGTWQPPQAVQELNVGGVALRPNVSQNGREIVFDSNRAGSQMFDIWYSHRATPHAPWAEPVRLLDPSINSPANETRAWMSTDGQRLYFGSNRAGSFDLYVADRR